MTAADDRPRYSRLVAALPATVPFVPPEALERRIGRTLALRIGANESAFGPSPKVVHGAVGFHPQVVFLAAGAGAERGGAVVAGAGVDAVEYDHGPPRLALRPGLGLVFPAYLIRFQP